MARPVKMPVPAPTAVRVTARRPLARPAWAVALLIAAALIAMVELRPNDHHERAVALVRAVHDAIY